MAALLWRVGGREAEDGTPRLWWLMSSTHPGAGVSGHVPSERLAGAVCMHV